ncbi:filamentous hemagglutinin N-terminal domain-containing protein [Erwinia mallotivora]|uniref:two-partner secretion domain-containing protein n=1 Tax=Erwinia mallotivora TaxID=69222 RepID=UPI0035EFAEA1
MKMHKFNLVFLATSVAMMSQVALADPATYTHLNGSTVVNINKADTNGLSHNMWSDFNVSDKGMVLNNSTADLIRDSGNIAKNNNLDAAAKVILNEVISNKASTLKGFIEVAGTAADVIIANPNGITCTGCSFVNASRATLTTGTPVLYDGALTADESPLMVG